MGKQNVLVSFRREISSLCERKMPQINPELSVFVVFDAISVHYPRDFVLSFNTINSTTTERAMQNIFEENIAVCFFKNTSE